MNLEMIQCPKCRADFPKKRRELGYHVCINCSTVKPVVGITTIEGTGDHTYNDLIIMDQDRANTIAYQAAKLSGKKSNIELLDLDKDEDEITYSVERKVQRLVDKDSKDAYKEDEEEEDEENVEIEGVDY